MFFSSQKFCLFCNAMWHFWQKSSHDTQNFGKKLAWPFRAPDLCLTQTLPCLLFANTLATNNILIDNAWWGEKDQIWERSTVCVCWNHVSQQIGFLVQLHCLSAHCGRSCFLLTSGPLAALQLQKQKQKEMCSSEFQCFHLPKFRALTSSQSSNWRLVFAVHCQLRWRLWPSGESTSGLHRLLLLKKSSSYWQGHRVS